MGKTTPISSEVNREEGFKWLKKAARTRLPEAKWQCGLALLNGEGCPQNKAKALFWLTNSQPYQEAEFKKLQAKIDSQLSLEEKKQLELWLESTQIDCRPNNTMFEFE
jgi:hypothetical protein